MNKVDDSVNFCLIKLVQLIYIVQTNDQVKIFSQLLFVETESIILLTQQ